MLRVLDVLKIVLFLVLIVMFINFNRQVAIQAAATQKIAQSTNSVVRGQADILNAIKQVTDDTHTTAADQTAIIICMLQVPVYQRTTDLQMQCRNSVAALSAGSSTQTTQSSTGTTNQVPSPKPTPAPAKPQSDTSQPASPSVFDRLLVNPIKNIINIF